MPPNPPTLESTRGVHKSGIEPADRPALLSGFILYPEALHDHVEELAHLNIADRGCAALRDQLVQIAMSGQHLDRDGLKTILAAASGGHAMSGAVRCVFPSPRQAAIRRSR